MHLSQKRRATIFILLTLVLDAMGIGLIVPVMPDLIVELEGGSVGEAALWGGILLTTFSAMQFLFSPLLGALSDRYGRRPVLLISLAVMAADYIIMGLAHSIWLLLLTRIVGGITAATHSTAGAVMADISSEKERAANFGLVGAAFGIGFILGPAIGGVLGEYGLRAPFYAAAALALANMTLGYFALPETVTEANRRAFDWRRANPLGAFRAIARLPGISSALLLLFVYEFAMMVYPAIWAYFPKERFGWGPGMVGLSMMLFGVSMALVQGGLIRIALRHFRERSLLIFGLTFELGCFLLLTVITSGFWALVLVPVSALGAVINPTLMGWMSRAVPDNAQGELQGIVGSARSVAAIFAPLAMTKLFENFTADGAPYMPGAPFLLSAVLMLFCLLIFAVKGRDMVREAR